MLGLLGMVPSGIKMALVGALAVAVGLFYWHYTVVKTERDQAFATIGAMEVAKKIQDTTIVEQRKAIATWSKHQAQMQETLGAMAKTQMESGKQARRLNDVLAKHDLGKLALRKPGLIERRINSGTADIIRMLNAATAERKSDDGAN